MTKLFSLLFFATLWLTSYSQSIENYFKQQTIQDIPKLYIHTDREYYYMGDTLWFSPYLISSNKNKLLTEDCNLYVDLINSQGNVVEEKNFIMHNGICSGYLIIDNPDLSTEALVLRAYTDKMKAFGEAVFFRKTIKVSNSININDSSKISEIHNEQIHINFYPEGGFLLKDRKNHVAFVAYNQQGKRINFDGKIITNDGQEINISTTFKGMGSFWYIPHTNKIKVKSIHSKSIQINMPKLQEQGSKLMVSKNSDKAISVYIDASHKLSNTEYFIATFYQGQGQNYIKVENKNLHRPISIPKTHLGYGINRLILLNANLEPLSERLVFVSKTDDLLPVNINMKKVELKTREEAQLTLDIPDMMNESEWARLSLAVVNEDLLTHQGYLQNIQSYLLLDSELKEQIQTPGLYFIDDSISSKQKLDLLMLTNGWRNYLFNNEYLQAKTDEQVSQHGITFAGNVKKIFSNRPYINTDVYLNLANKQKKELLVTKTDKNGYFKFDSIIYCDTTLVMIQCNNYRGKSNSRLELSEMKLKHHPVNKSDYKYIEDIGELSLKMNRLKYINEMSLKEFFPKKDFKLLDEINIVAEKKKYNDTHFRIYGKTTQSKKITKGDHNYRNIFSYLQGRFAGVQVIGETVTIRGKGSIVTSSFTNKNEDPMNDPNKILYLLDGMPIIPDQLKYIPMSEIELIEVIKPPETVIFGFKGANGVISVFSRSNAYEPEIKEIPGTVIDKIQGFEKHRIFYSPVYNEDNLESEIPDFRQTLYWNPSIILDTKAQPLSFYTCDNLANYKIIVEGITKTGKICIGEAGFMVNERSKESPVAMH